MERAKANALVEFWTSQPYFDVCGVYYGDRFDGCLKQVGSIYPDLDLSKVTINDTVAQTLRGDDAISDEPDDSTHMVEQEVKDDGVVTAQSIPEGPVAPVVSSAGSVYRGWSRHHEPVCLRCTPILV